MIIYTFSVKGTFQQVLDALTLDDKIRMKLKLGSSTTSYMDYHMDLDTIDNEQNPAMQIRFEKDLQNDSTLQRTIIKVCFYWTHAIFTSPTALKRQKEVHNRISLIQRVLKGKLPEFEIEPEVI